MRRFLPYIATLLLALWLPVTQHCGLEAVGWVPTETPHESHCCDHAPPCSHDGCNIVEEGLVKPSADLAKVAPPALTVCVFTLCLQLAWPETTEISFVVRSPTGPPLDWISSWQFIRRAAPLSRAPSLLS